MAVFFSRFPRVDRGPNHIEATDVRQGRWGRHVFWVLVISTVLAVLALFGSWAMRADDFRVESLNTVPRSAEANPKSAQANPGDIGTTPSSLPPAQ